MEDIIKYYDEDADFEESFGGNKDRRKPKGRRKKADLYLKEKDKRSTVDNFDDASLQHLFVAGYLTSIVGELKSGKEATVFFAEGPAGELAAKIYRDKVVRSFQNDSVYKHKRVIPNAHRKKIDEQRAKLGVSRDEAYWIYHEYMNLWQLYDAGIPVPTPMIGPGVNEIAQAGRVLLMEFIGSEGESAPRLADIRLEGEEAQSAWQQSVDIYIKLLKLGKVHGDYSTYNLLWWQDKVMVIDFPQMIEFDDNRHAMELIERDLNSLCMSFKRHGIDKDPFDLLNAIKREVNLNKKRPPR